MAGLKQQWRELRKGRPGHRFQERYERKHKEGKGRAGWRRFVRPTLGTVVLVAGLILCVIPGPGLPFVFLGGALLAERSRAIARAMDWCEVQLRRIFRWGIGLARRVFLKAKHA